MIITTFKSASTKGKVPISPTGNKTFTFESQDVNSLKDLFTVMSSEFILSKPLQIQDPITTFRRKKDLTDYYNKHLTYIVLDIDKVFTLIDRDRVINYFKNNNFNYLLGKSRSYDDVSSFNLKGLLRVDIENDRNSMKKLIRKFQNDLKDHCSFDATTISDVGYQAPTNRVEILSENDGDIITQSYIDKIDIDSVDVQPLPSVVLESKVYKNITEMCLEVFSKLGFRIGDTSNENGSINFSHYTEVNSPFGFFWFRENPYMMHHNNKNRSVSIYDIIKESPEGKEFIKESSKVKQSELLNRYTKEADVITHERWLEIDHSKTELISEFLSTPKAVLKVKSPMGTAKTSVVKEVIKQSKELNKRILIVTNRISVARDFNTKYGIKLYMDKSGYLPGDSVIVQFDSIWKYNMENFDLVILDEFMSILLHHRSNLSSNANINIAKFKIGLEKKQVLVADAFLFGFEDMHFKDRKVLSLSNEYRDDVRLFSYKDKPKFIESILESLESKADNEALSASFMSNSMLETTEYLCKKAGYNVVTLTSNTPELTKKLIYDKFNDDDHVHWDIILFSPTLTVGVSNLTNTTKHFHYDSGNAGDVISSLQMIKRSRKVSEIHFFLQERQLYRITEADVLNNNANNNIQQYYKGKDTTLLIDIHPESGNFKLSSIGKYVNKIEALNNILENNHKNSFLELLKHQFMNPVLDITRKGKLNLSKISKDVKEHKKMEIQDMFRDFADIYWDDFQIDEIKQKTTELTPEERVKVLINTIDEKTHRRIHNTDDLFKLAELEIQSNFTFISRVKRLAFFLKTTDEYLMNMIEKSVSSSVQSLQSQDSISFLEDMILAKSINMLDYFTPKEIAAIEKDTTINFKQFLQKIGYDKISNRHRLNPEIRYFVDYFM